MVVVLPAPGGPTNSSTGAYGSSPETRPPSSVGEGALAMAAAVAVPALDHAARMRATRIGQIAVEPGRHQPRDERIRPSAATAGAATAGQPEPFKHAGRRRFRTDRPAQRRP